VFTGLVTHIGRILEAQARADGALRLVVQPEQAFEGLVLGGSVAVDGVCLTLVDLSGGRLTFDVVPETLRKTTLGGHRPGCRVNLERALRVGDELGGHWVEGHVEGTAELTALERSGADVRLTLRHLPEAEGGLLAKGSVTLDGVSLTLGEVWSEGGSTAGGPEAFHVYLIPHTLTVTTLAERQVGERLNLEADVLGRWVRRMLHARGMGRGPLPGSRAQEAAPTAPPRFVR